VATIITAIRTVMAWRRKEVIMMSHTASPHKEAW